MPPEWMSHLVRARQAQEDGATVRLALARRARIRAQDEAKREAARVAALAGRKAEADAGAFVAAAVALQAAAATHAAAVDAAAEADGWVERRGAELTNAAVARHVAETLHDRSVADETARAATAEQLALDETAAVRHLARHRAEDRSTSDAGRPMSSRALPTERSEVEP